MDVGRGERGLVAIGVAITVMVAVAYLVSFSILGLWVAVPQIQNTCTVIGNSMIIIDGPVIMNGTTSSCTANTLYWALIAIIAVFGAILTYITYKLYNRRNGTIIIALAALAPAFFNSLNLIITISYLPYIYVASFVAIGLGIFMEIT